MFNTGLTLQLENKSNVLRDTRLLIVTDSSVCLQEIENILQGMTVQPHYQSVTCHLSSQELLEHQYDLIIYNYSQRNNDLRNSESSLGYCSAYPIEELAWWYNLESKIPLVLITEPLGEEKAIACLESGIDSYLLKSRICNLPSILEKVIRDCLPNPTNRIQQLLSQINLLEQEISKLQKQNIELKTAEINTNQEYFSHLNHELRSPLANILQFARMLKDEIYGALNSKQTEYIAGILTSGDHLSELINDYLDIAKIDANHEELYPENVLVEDICEASLVLVQGKAKEKKLDLLLDIADEVDFCYADSLRLKQILINLLSNAVKFTEQGLITLEVKLVSEMILFSVIDTGIGISPEDAAKLFKPFQQINTPIHRKHKGTGLGLALSRKLAQLHGGDITLTSRPGDGSCFTVSLPHYKS